MDLEALTEQLCAEHRVVGGQVAVLTGGEVQEGAAGVAGLHTGLPVTPDTLFQVGSTTKLHTAVLVMQLVEEGLVGLDTPVVEQLPGFRLGDATATATVTPRHLMSMSSGIDNGPYTDFGPGDEALSHYVDALATIPVTGRPGVDFGYSNASTNVSGRLVERLTGLTWEDALRTRLLEPAGLADSVCGADGVVTRRFAVGHVQQPAGGWEVVRHWGLPRSMGPAGGTLCATAGDLVRLGAIFLRGGSSLGGERLLSSEAVTRMQSRQVEVPPTLVAEWWGLGPYGWSVDGRPVLGHSGTNTGGSSYLMWVPGADVAVATTVNTPRAGYAFAKSAFAELLPELVGVRMQPREQVPPNVQFEPGRLVGRYEMSEVAFDIDVLDGHLTVRSTGAFGNSTAPSRLVPIGGDRFLPTDAVVDGGRGWAVAFLGDPEQPASHLLNGFFSMRRAA